MSDFSQDTTLIPIPQWLHQIANTAQSCSNQFNNEESCQNDGTTRKQKNVGIISNKSKKMRILPTKSLPITRKYSSSVFKHILEEANILFSDDYRQFLTFVKLKAELQKSQTLISTQTKPIT